MIRKVVIIIAFIISLLSPNMNAQQQVPVGTETINIQGVEYYLYKVQKKEGLYRVSVNTQVSQEEIVRLNPEAKDGLQEGQVLKIPVLKSSPSASTNTQQTGIQKTVTPKKQTTTTEQKKIIHTVAPKETLYGISKIYGVTTEELLNENPGIVGGNITTGMQLKIPSKGKAPKKQYIQHEVQAGETIYSIARKYKLPAVDVSEANQDIKEASIVPGMTLTIPIEAPESENTWRKTLNERPFITHEVAKKETLFGISKKYNIDIQYINSFNPNIDLGSINKGDKIKIPTQEWVNALNDSIKQTEIVVEPTVVAQHSNTCNDYKYFPTRPVIKIALLLPFNLAGQSTATSSTDNADDSANQSYDGRSITGRSKVIVEFYEGFIYALEAFKKKGVNVQLYVYDTTDDLVGITNILHKPELAEVDLIVGPAHTAHIKPVSDFASQHGIKMVNPFTPTNSELNNNSKMFQMTPSDSLILSGMAQKIAIDGAGKKVIIIRSSAESAFETNLTEAIKQAISQTDTNGSEKAELIEHIYGKSGQGSLSEKIKTVKENIIVIPSNEEIFVNKVILSLETLAKLGSHAITLYGLPEWLKFQSVDPAAIHKLNGHIVTYYGIDYKNEETKLFLSEYRELFQTEPYAFAPYFQKPSSNGGYSRFGIWGYDIATYFVGAITEYGPNFENCLNSFNATLIQSNFKFKRTSNWGGLYNNGLIIMKFNQDYTISREPFNTER